MVEKLEERADLLAELKNGKVGPLPVRNLDYTINRCQRDRCALVFDGCYSENKRNVNEYHCPRCSTIYKMPADLK